MMHRERLTRFYEQYNPTKVHEIDGVLERYKGKEDQLFKALIKKYGPEPIEDEEIHTTTQEKKKESKVSSTLNESTTLEDINVSRLRAFYTKYNPDKLDSVQDTLDKYKGKEAQLFDALVRKYGPEPGDSDNEQDEDQEEKQDQDKDEDEEEKSLYPPMKTVLYCPIDTLPAEYCEYGPMFDECKPWLEENCPDLYLLKYNRTVADFLDIERQIAQGVQGLSLKADTGLGKEKTVKRKKKNKTDGAYKNQADCQVRISRSARKGRKRLTFINGLEDFEGVNMKDASKALGKKFACSSSISKTDNDGQQIQLQGDCLVELPDVLMEMFGISEDQIKVTEELKKK